MEHGSYQALLILAAFFFVFLNAFFVAAEFAIVKVRSTRLDELIRQRRPRAVTAKRLVSSMDEYLSATQLGITLASLALGWIGEPAFAELFAPMFVSTGALEPVLAHTLAIVTAFLLITFLHIVLGELAPKSLAIQLPEPTVMAIASPLVLFYRMTYPFIWALNGTASVFLRLIGIRPASEIESAHSEEELRLILAHSSQKGVLGEDERRMLERVFDFGDRSVRQIMVPAGEVGYLDVQYSLEDNLRIALSQGHTRYPLCEGGLDHVIGIIHVKDLLWRYQELGPDFDLKRIGRPVLFVPESKLLRSLLPELRRARTHLAVVVDEFGSTVGVVTLEDILEELVGEIQDEFDGEAPPPMIQELGENGWLVNGRTLLEQFEEAFDLQLADEENDTIAGHVMMVLGRTARVGDEITVGDRFRIRVTEMRHLQITDLEVRKMAGGSGA